MNRNNLWKFIIVVLVVVWSFVEMYPPIGRDLVQEFKDKAIGSRKDAAYTNILERLEKAGIASGAVNDVAEVARHPQLEARARWAQVDSPAGPIAALLPPHNLANAAPRMGAVPALGQHTDEILRELSEPRP